MTLTNTLVLSVFPIMLVAAGIGDFLTMRIPNWLTGAMVVLFFVVALIAGMPWQIMMWHVLAGVAVLAVGILLFFTIRFGGGDAKMLAAGALWVGLKGLAPFVFYTAVCGGALAIVAMIWVYFKQTHDETENALLKKIFSKKIDVPYGVAIAGGGILAFPQTWWVQSMI